MKKSKKQNQSIPSKKNSGSKNKKLSGVKKSKLRTNAPTVAPGFKNSEFFFDMNAWYAF